jgi:hypothetical protein
VNGERERGLQGPDDGQYSPYDPKTHNLRIMPPG